MLGPNPWRPIASFTAALNRVIRKGECDARSRYARPTALGDEKANSQVDQIRHVGASLCSVHHVTARAAEDSMY